jgi:hypothetical protein
MSTESTLQKKLVKRLKLLGSLVYKFSSPSHRGVPDLVVVPPSGITFFIEVKNPKGTGRLSKLQEIEIKKIRGNNAAVYVIQREEQLNEIIKEHFDG